MALQGIDWNVSAPYCKGEWIDVKLETTFNQILYGKNPYFIFVPLPFLRILKEIEIVSL